MLVLKVTSHRPVDGSGFTLVEVLFSLAFIVILAAVSVPLYQSLQVSNDLEAATFTLAHNLRRAQLLSQAVEADSSWGVKINPGAIVIFQGSSYGARLPEADEVSDFSSNIVVGGITEVVFSKLVGDPLTTGNITLTSVTDQTRTVSVGGKGRIQY